MVVDPFGRDLASAGQLQQEDLLHNQTALLLKTVLLDRRNRTAEERVIIDVPYQLKRSPSIVVPYCAGASAASHSCSRHPAIERAWSGYASPPRQEVCPGAD